MKSLLWAIYCDESGEDSAEHAVVVAMLILSALVYAKYCSCNKIRFAVAFLASPKGSVSGTVDAIADKPRHSRILRLKEVKERTGYSRTTLYRLKNLGILPQADKLEGSTSAGWFEDVVDDFVESRRPGPVESEASSIPGAVKIPQAVAPIRSERGIEPSARQEGGRGGMSRALSRQPSPGADLIATGFKLLGCEIYVHSATRRGFLDLGKMSTPFAASINIAGVIESESMDDIRESEGRSASRNQTNRRIKP